MRSRKTVSNELIGSLLADYKKLEYLIGEHGLLKQLTKKLTTFATNLPPPSGNTRNGFSCKPLKGKFGKMPIEAPVTDTAASSHKSSPNTHPAGRVSTTISCRCWMRWGSSLLPTK